MTHPFRLLTRALLVLALAAGLGLPDHEQGNRLRVGVTSIIDLAPPNAAIDQGYFKAEGLEIDPVTAPVSHQLLTRLAAGQIHIAFSSIVTVTQAIENARLHGRAAGHRDEEGQRRQPLHRRDRQPDQDRQ